MLLDPLGPTAAFCRLGVHGAYPAYPSAPRPRQVTTPAPHHSVFYRPDALPATQSEQTSIVWFVVFELMSIALYPWFDFCSAAVSAVNDALYK